MRAITTSRSTACSTQWEKSSYGGFYVDQEPYLVAANGSALIRLDDLEATYGRELRLHPMYNGWSIIEGVEDGSTNYISAAGQMLCTG